MALKIVLITFSLLIVPILTYKPVVLIHGVMTGAASMEMIKFRIEEKHPGTIVYNVNRFESWSSLETMWHQVLEIGLDVANISAAHPEGINLIDFCSRRFCDDRHLAAELQHAKQVLRDNKLQIPRPRHRNRVKPTTVDRLPAVLPYVRGVTDKIGYILKRASIKTYFKPPKKISQSLPPVKCHIPLQDAGVYKLDCDCGLSYIGQTKRSIGTRVKEHIADVKHRRSTKSAVAEHAEGSSHYIRFDKPQILAKEHKFLPRMVREAIEIKKHPNFNREDGWKISPTWDPIIHKLKTKPKSSAARLQDTVSSYCVGRNTNN